MKQEFKLYKLVSTEMSRRRWWR